MNQVIVQDKISKKNPVGRAGTTQGSVLGGILYTIYSNDLPADREEDPTDYVDDHTDNCKAKTLHGLQDKLQIEANNTSEWLKNNEMAISSEKSKITVMKSPLPPLLSIQLDGDTLYPTHSERYLGLYLSSDMTWKKYLY